MSALVTVRTNIKDMDQARRTLESLGFNVQVAEDGKDSLTLIGLGDQRAGVNLLLKKVQWGGYGDAGLSTDGQIHVDDMDDEGKLKAAIQFPKGYPPSVAKFSEVFKEKYAMDTSLRALRRQGFRGCSYSRNEEGELRAEVKAWAA